MMALPIHYSKELKMPIEYVLNHDTPKSATGEFTAKIQDRPEHISNQVGIYWEGKIGHFFGAHNTDDPLTYQDIYIHVTDDPVTGPAFYQLTYVSRSGNKGEKFTVEKDDKDARFTFDFDNAKQHYKMTFDVVAKDPTGPTIKIVGSFNLRAGESNHS
jgi:hypothetical protein